jgi:hypothetical protein
VTLDDVNLPVKLAELLAKGLGDVGMDLPLVAAQAFALVLYGAAFVWGLRKIRAEGSGKLVGWLVSVGFGLGMAGVVGGWAQAFVAPLPLRVTGQVELTGGAGSVRLADVRVQLLDFRGDNIALEPGIVDSRSGHFVLTHAREFGDRPRAIRVSAPGCADLDAPISRSRLRSGASFLVRFSCEADQ